MTTRLVEGYGGLKRQPPMEEIINYLANGQEKTDYPDRQAKFIRNHPFMTQLDFFETRDEQEKTWEEQRRKEEARRLEKQRQTSEGLEVATAGGGQGANETEARQLALQDRNQDVAWAAT